MMSKTTQVKEKELSTLEIQDLIYKRELKLKEIRKGMTFNELLKRANDPRRYSKRKKP